MCCWISANKTKILRKLNPNIDQIKVKGWIGIPIYGGLQKIDNNSLNELGEPEWAGPADGGHQGDVCQEAGNDEKDEHSSGTIRVSSKHNISRKNMKIFVRISQTFLRKLFTEISQKIISQKKVEAQNKL